MRLFTDYNLVDGVSASNRIDNIHAAHDSSKNCVTTVKVRLGRVGNKPLRATSVLTGKCHTNRAAIIRSLINFAPNLILRTAIAVSTRNTSLNPKRRADAIGDTA